MRAIVYEKMLVPIDGSEFSREALSHVVRIAPREVVFVSVMESVASAMARQTGIVADIPGDISAQVEASEVAALKRYQREARQQLEASGWSGPVTQLVRHGKAGPQIVEVAAEQSCDIIVMATHGLTGVRRAVLGSVADHVVSHVTGAAILLVRP